jgi:hypothetical protein
MGITHNNLVLSELFIVYEDTYIKNI